ncbi:MAG: cysteine hydrolase family protein [Solirubrobacterales bacterium]
MQAPTHHTEALAALESLAKRPVMVTIDLHRGHLDPEVATLPLPAERAAPLVERCASLFNSLRGLGIPIVHVITAYRNRAEILSNPYWRFQSERPDSPRARIAEHNLEGMPGLELMPGLLGEGDIVVDTKKRYDCLLGTDLEITLESLECDTVLLTGVNTNSCVIATGIAASVRDYAVFMVEDGIDTMLGPELHDAALSVVRASFGWAIDAESLLARLGDQSGSGR